jgi:hypothetical protein
MSDERELHDLWRSGTGVAAPPPTEALRPAAASFVRAVSRRILLEQVVGALMIAWFLWEAVTAERNMTRIGAVLIVAGVAFVVAQLTRRAAPGNPAVAADCATFLRDELVRQRDLRRSVRRWYLGPLVPGFSVFYLDLILHAMAQGAGYGFAITGVVAFIALPVVMADWGNRRRVRELQREIDELDAGLRGL